MFHNVAHVHDDNCQCLVLSGPQMKSAGVVVNHLVIAGQQTARELVVTVDDVVFDMSISKPKNNGKVALPSFELFLLNNSTIEKTVRTTADTPWHPLDVPEMRSCSVCGERNCRRGRCIELNSFGLGVTPTADLCPGKCEVFCTLKDMSSILHCPMKKWNIHWIFILPMVVETWLMRLSHCHHHPTVNRTCK